MNGSTSREAHGHDAPQALPCAPSWRSRLAARGGRRWLAGARRRRGRRSTRRPSKSRAARSSIAPTIRGEIKALRSQSLTAPSDAGDLRILELAANGSKVRKGDVVIAFDATALKQRFDEKQSDLRASQAEIAKADAEGRLKLEEFTTGRVTAEFDVERAKLDVKAGELQSRFDEQKARLGLSDKEQKLRETDTVLSTAAARSRRRRSAASRASSNAPRPRSAGRRAVCRRSSSARPPTA